MRREREIKTSRWRNANGWLRHGTDRWEAAGWLAMTLEQLENGYGPDFQEEAAEAFGGRRG
jgi:hypothetical protein